MLRQAAANVRRGARRGGRGAAARRGRARRPGPGGSRAALRRRRGHAAADRQRAAGEQRAAPSRTTACSRPATWCCSTRRRRTSATGRRAAAPSCSARPTPRRARCWRRRGPRWRRMTAAARPGAPRGAVADAALAHLRDPAQAARALDYGLGHGIGLDVEEPPFATPGRRDAAGGRRRPGAARRPARTPPVAAPWRAERFWSAPRARSRWARAASCGAANRTSWFRSSSSSSAPSPPASSASAGATSTISPRRSGGARNRLKRSAAGQPADHEAGHGRVERAPR